MPRKSLHLSQIRVVMLVFVVTVSSVLSTAATETILYSFNPYAHGQYPLGGLIVDAAGNLYGTTYEGGAYASGTIFELSPNGKGWTETVLYSFMGIYGGGSDGSYPTGRLTLDASGNLYGTTSGGGSKNAGTVFKLSRSNARWVETLLWNFQQFSMDDGRGPDGGLVFDAAGNLYGATGGGGAATQTGTVFRLEPQSTGQWKETVLYAFQGLADGAYPSSVVMDSAGNLYGTTFDVNISDGSVFKLTPSLSGYWTETNIYTFTGGTDGDQPGGPLIFDDAGNLYGTTVFGGSGVGCEGPCGTVYELTPGPGGVWNEEVLYSFNGKDGQSPEGSLFRDQSGNLYGTTFSGGTSHHGTVYELSPNSSGSWTETVLWSFTGLRDGLEPAYGVVGFGGQLYGAIGTYSTTNAYNPNGNVFSLAPDNTGHWHATRLTDFPTTDGSLPSTSLVADANGNFYGTTLLGGVPGYGIVFKLSHSENSWKETVLYSFAPEIGARYGYGAVASALTFDAAGNLYGETEYGGVNRYGTVFELSPTAGEEWTEKDIFTFTGVATGMRPLGGLVFDAAGNLYGTAQKGGDLAACALVGCGTVFELTPSGGQWTETILHSFSSGSDGAYPAAGLIFDLVGNLYGTTYGGGSGDNGTVFELSPSSGGKWTESVLHAFTNTYHDGAFPLAGLVIDQAGNLYGTTVHGGAHGSSCGRQGCGMVFELSPGATGWTEKVLHSFIPSDTIYPTSTLILDPSGNLYGTTQGEAGIGGDVFQLSPLTGGGWNETVLHSFSDPFDGAIPQAGVIRDSAGHLYGTTYGGGQEGHGTVFEITP